MAFQFTKRLDGTTAVYLDGNRIGQVEKSEGWTVRGKPTHWYAKTNGGRVIGRYDTRNDAATALRNRTA
jgi:hypothetical protein